MKNENVKLRKRGGWRLSTIDRIKMSKRFSGKNNPFYGKIHSEETRKKNSGSFASNWKGGSSIEIYPIEFERLKRLDKVNKDYCQFCLRSKETFEKKLIYHHIDYDKKNNTTMNFVRLCFSCHSKTNFQREKWKSFFEQLKKAENKKFKNKEILITATRPDIIKFWPLKIKLKNKAITIHTGQQKELSSNVFKTLGWIPEFDLNIMEENQTLLTIFSNASSFLNPLLYELKPKRVWVQGDTMSAFSSALCAFLLKIPLVHLEAGLRTNDKYNPFPEEMNRRMIDHMSDVLFAPTERAVENLRRENISGFICLVGNTIVDALEMIKEKLPNERPIKEKYVLATVHRRESFGDDMRQIFEALKELSKTIKIVIPAHPNPNVQKMIKEVGIDTVLPMNYINFLWYLRDCEYVISDSGGIQEEAPSFNKKIIVLRKTTERQEVIEKGYGILIPEMKKEHILKKINEFIRKDPVKMHNPFGDGKTTERIVKILQNYDK